MAIRIALMMAQNNATREPQQQASIALQIALTTLTHTIDKAYLCEAATQRVGCYLVGHLAASASRGFSSAIEGLKIMSKVYSPQPINR